MKLPDHVYEENRRQPSQSIFQFNQNTIHTSLNH